MEINTNNIQPAEMPEEHNLAIGQTIKETWACVRGFKGAFWLAFLIIILISGGIELIDGSLSTVASNITNQTLQSTVTISAVVIAFISNIVSILFSMGFVYLGLRRAADLSVSASMVFKGFSSPYIVKLILLEVIKGLLVLAFLCIPLIIDLIMVPTQGKALMITIDIICFIVAYLVFIRLSLAELAIFDQNLGAIEALKLSFHATKGKIWRIFWIGFLALLIIVVSVIPLGIGLIWTLPFITLIYPVIYKKLVGIHITQ